MKSITFVSAMVFAASSTYVILFVGTHPTSMSALSVGQVVCESTLIIQLHSCMLDKNEVLHLWERWGAASPTSVILLHLSCVVRKPDFRICETKTQISFAVTAKLISAFVFATRIVQSLHFLNPKFQASSHLQ